jgi:hypothetical protein
VPLVYLRRQLRLDAACLVVGSMAPDFEYFVRVAPLASISHTKLGVLTWGVPVTLASVVIARYVLAWPVLLVAPRCIARRATVLATRPWPGRLTAATVLSLVISAAIGSASHLAWDALTHADGWGPKHLMSLHAIVDAPILGHMVVHRVLQYVSSIVGLVVLAILVVHWLHRQAAVELPPAPRAWPRAVFAACIAAAVALASVRIHRLHATDVDARLVGVVAGCLAGALIASVIVRGAAARFRSALLGL